METHMIFETHAHYDDEAFEADREELLDSMQENGIDRIVNACASLESLKDTEALMEKYPFVYGAFGIHPDDADKVDAAVLDEIRRYCDMEKAGTSRRCSRFFGFFKPFFFFKRLQCSLI